MNTTNTDAASWLLRDHPEMQELMCRQFDTLHDLMEVQTLERFELQKRLVREIQGQRKQPSNSPITVDADTAPRVLPPMVPLRPRRSKAIDVSCPTCGAKAGKPCFVMTRGGGANATVLDPPQVKEGYHSKRLNKAKTQ